MAVISNYVNATYNEDPDDHHPLRVATRAATGEAHEFGDLGEIQLTEDEAQRLTVYLVDQYDEDLADELREKIDV